MDGTWDHDFLNKIGLISLLVFAIEICRNAKKICEDAGKGNNGEKISMINFRLHEDEKTQEQDAIIPRVAGKIEFHEK